MQAPRWLALVATLTGLGCAACAGAPPQQAASSTSVAPRVADYTAPSLAAAMAASTDLGALPAATPVSFQVTLADRDPKGLQALLDHGQTVSPQEFAASFGPDPAAVAALTQRLRGYSLTASWQAGDTQLTVHGAAAGVDRLFGISIHQYREHDGSVFHAPAHNASTTAVLGPEVMAVTGLDNYRRPLTYALPASDKNGFTYSDADGFYDISPLRNAGIDGRGQTVVIIDWAVPSQALLQAFTQKFTPTQPLTIDVHTNSAWGQPFPPGDQNYAGTVGESALDVDVVHG
ncbi:MAG TPA: protease pro-enzyme activation domain-containing protein, partial [Dehalococcoidia bacterium]|nr:protease pro-enzyme activation domain-containing protein [Dehalococcoidia bacterium]